MDSLEPRLYSSATLRALGFSPSDLVAAVRSGAMWHVVRGWYAPVGTDAQLIRAVRLGGRLGCASALRIYGAWSPPDRKLHLAMPFSASGRRLSARESGTLEDVVVHWRLRGDRVEWTDGIAPLRVAAAHLIRCVPEEEAVAVLDSLIYRGLASEGSVREIIRDAPARFHHFGGLIDGRSEEGIESLVRVALLRSGVDSVPQVVVPGVGRVDLLIDGWLVVELDGRATHAQEKAFVSDRRRAAALTGMGYGMLRFAYVDVVYHRKQVIDAIRATLAQHRPNSRRA